MRTKELTNLERRLHCSLNRKVKAIDERCKEATIAEKVQLISIPEFAELPKTIKIDKEECEEYVTKYGGGWRCYGDTEDIPDEINTNTLYIGWFYQDKDVKYAVWFENERFALKESRLVMADLTRLYLIEKFLKEKGFKVVKMYFTDDNIVAVEEHILADIRSYYMNEEKMEQGIVATAVELGIEEKVIKCCLNVERRHNKRMINFLEGFWNNGELLEDKVKKYLTEVGAM